MKSLQTNIPLFQVLRELKDHQRQIIIDHLDAKSCNALVECVKCVLKRGPKKKGKRQTKLRACIKQYHKDFAHILGKRQSSRQLAKVGGFPLGLILSTAVPLLMSFLKK